MTQTGHAALTLAELDAMSIEEAQALPFDQRDRLLDLIIADGRHDATASVSYRTGLYSDYFEEDLTRMLKVRAVTVHCRGTTSSNFDGVPCRRDLPGTIPRLLPARRDHPDRGPHQLRTGGQDDCVPDQHGPVGRIQHGVPGVHSQPALPRRHRHHRSRPKAVAHRNSRMRRLPRRRLASVDNWQTISPLLRNQESKEGVAKVALPRSTMAGCGAVESRIPVFRCGGCRRMSSGMDLLGDAERHWRHKKPRSQP